MTEIRNPNAETFGFEYDDASRLVAKELPSGATTYMDYDDANRLSSIIHAKSDDSIIASFAYERDSRGNPTSEEVADGNVRYFGYDELSRLTSETWVVDDDVTAEKVYVYDAASNRVRLEEAGWLVSASREATALRSLGRKPQVRRVPSRRVPKGRHCAGPMPPLQGSGACLGPDPGFAPWATTCRPYRASDGDLRRWEKTDVGGTKLYRWDAGASGQPGLAVVQEADSDGDTTARAMR